MSKLKNLRAGTRGSQLAQKQTSTIQATLRSFFPDLNLETVIIKTAGDKITDVPLSQVPGKSFFTKEIEEALLNHKIDFAVHSLKDLPTEMSKGLMLGAIPDREDPRDCILSNEGWNLKNIPKGKKIGTSSLRRKAQILALRPDLLVQDLRGNLDTRIKKLEEGTMDSIMVAAAGVDRLEESLQLGKRNIKVQKLKETEFLPAVGQGFLAVQIREGDEETQNVIQKLNITQAYSMAQCERSFLHTLQGGCQVPVGISSKIQNQNIEIEGLIASTNGREVVRGKKSGSINSSSELGESLALDLLKKGGDKILSTIRK